MKKEKISFSIVDVLLLLVILLGVVAGISWFAGAGLASEDPGLEVADLVVELEKASFADSVREGQSLYSRDREPLGKILSVTRSVDRETGRPLLRLHCEMQAGAAVPGQDLELETRELIFVARVESAWAVESGG